MAGSTNRSKTSWVLESTKGVIPTSPVFNEFRVTSNQIAYAPTRTITTEIRSDRQVSDRILVDLNNGGQIGTELSFGSHDVMIAAAYQNSWVNKPSITVVTAATEISALSTTTATVASALGTPFKAGMLVYTSGFANAANNGLLIVVSSSTPTTVVFPSSTFVVDAAPQVGAKLQVVGFAGASADLVADATAGNHLTSTALDFTTLGLNVGEWVKIGGDLTANLFATTADNSWCHISAIVAHTITFDVVPASWAADSGTGKLIWVFAGDYLTNGTTQNSYTIERQQQDLTSPVYEYFTGSQVDQMSWSFKAASIISGAFTYMGTTPATSLMSTTTRASGATDIAAGTNPVLNAASNVARLAIAGTLVGSPSYINQISFDLKNNLGRETAVAVLGASGIRDGEIDLSGSISAYMGDGVLLGYVLNDTTAAILIQAGRSDGTRQRLSFYVPQAKFTGDAKVPGKNQSRMFTGTYAAKLDATFGTMSAHRHWYLPVLGS